MQHAPADLTQNIYKTFARYVSLNVFSMLGLSFYILADTFFIAMGCKTAGLVALNIALPGYNVINGLSLLLGIGGATRFSVAVGEGKREKCTPIFWQTAIFGLGTGVLIAILGGFFSKNIVAAFGAAGDILPLADVYLKTMMLFAPAFMLNNIMVHFVRNDHNPHLATCAMLTASFSNIVLDYVFIMPLGMGMFGAAFATGLAPLISLLVLSAHFFKKKNSFHIKPSPFCRAEIRPTLFAGFPSLVTELSSGLVLLVFNKVILSISGSDGVGAYGVITNVAFVCTAIFSGVVQGAQPLLSVNFGAANFRNLKRLLAATAGVCFGFGVLLYVFVNLFSTPLVAAFNREANAALARMAEGGIPIYFSAFFVMGLNICASSFFACVAKAKPSFTISILRGFGIVLPLVFLLPLLWGMTGVWFAVPLAELFTFLLSVPFVISYFKKQARTP